MFFQLKDVQCGYGKTVVVVVRDILLPAGKISLLVGHNGSGKTTFLKTLCRVIPVLTGKIPLDIHTCLLPEELGFPGNLMPLDIFKTLCPLESNADTILRELSITKNKRFDQLSKGNRQKLRIAVSESLARHLNKTILCLDEPLSGLDVSARETITSAWGGEGVLGKIWSEFGGHRIISQHSGRAPKAFQTIVVAKGQTSVHPPIASCDNWPALTHQ